MAHARAKLSVFGRQLLVACVTERGWTPAGAAEALGVSRATSPTKCPWPSGANSWKLSWQPLSMRWLGCRFAALANYPWRSGTRQPHRAPAPQARMMATRPSVT